MSHRLSQFASNWN